jgi:rRNA processing protein Gar1
MEPLYEMIDESAEHAADDLSANVVDISQDQVREQSIRADYEGVKIYDVSLAVSGHVYDIIGPLASVYERVPNFSFAQILSAIGDYETAQVYERVPNVSLAQILLATGDYEAAERVPNVEMGAHVYEQALHIIQRSQVYEQVPDASLAQILSASEDYSNTQIYEQVPNTSLTQTFSAVGDCSIREQIPGELLSAFRVPSVLTGINLAGLERTAEYESIHYGEMTLQLIRGVIQPYEQINGYERVCYHETMEQVWRKQFTGSQHWFSGYGRVFYSEEAIQLLKRMSGVIFD